MHSQHSPFTISQMSKKEVQEIALQWAKEEGWNPGLDDFDPFYAQDPHGFFVGRLNGEPIGSCSAVIYDDSFAFFGLYIVKAEFRKKGYGMQMTQHCLKYVGNRNFGLDGVLHMADKYANLGFCTAHLNIRTQGKIAIQPEKDPHIQFISDSLFKQIEAYDRLYFPAPRSHFLREWLKATPNRKSLAFLENEKIRGYGAIRRCYVGYKIGPLFADSFEIAEKLFLALASEAKGDVVFLDVPEPNVQALRLSERYHMQECFKTLRMYTRGNPLRHLDNIYGITTFELG